MADPAVTFESLDLSPMDETTGLFDIVSAVLLLALNELDGKGPAHTALYGCAELLTMARTKHNAFHIELLQAARLSDEAEA